MVKLDVLKEAYRVLPIDEMPFLNESIVRYKKEKPYIGLNIVHNLHITYSTICKLIPLVCSGANLTVTATKELQIDKGALALIKKANINFISPEELPDNFDIALDCGAGLLKYISPKIGAVEITQSGTTKYQANNINFPVISVDQSNTKKLETLFGTGDGFVRALRKITKTSLHNKKIVLFGYGKVGHGIVFALQEFTKNIIIIEETKAKVKQAIKDGYKSFLFMDVENVRHAIENALCAVTATGEPEAISKAYTEADFATCKYLANMGTEDEFGSKFSNKRVLCSKAPINFSIKEPTLSKYLDPILYAHNSVIDLLLEKKFTNGFHPLPIEFDLKILNRWEQIYSKKKKTNNSPIPFSTAVCTNLSRALAQA